MQIYLPYFNQPIISLHKCMEWLDAKERQGGKE